MCSRLSSNTAPASEWRCSRGLEISVTRWPDNQGADVGEITQDFQVPGAEKREDGRERSSEEPDVADHNTEEPTETESRDREEPEKRPGTTGVSRDAEHTENQERSEDTLKSRHIPGGAWLNKVRSFLRDNQLLKREKGGRRGEGRDG
ncbi:hypothetical protein NDU88_007391 [Pleurodeles waltl]|uniref:Uncharacterized protein n=1 Tax=Pleurodeles waltl TaxID=8319 RepID=A0AAV7SSD8_PLEWA|nr:hypothetical protein NDU88_007391 [Pleurodeles waltl]